VQEGWTAEYSDFRVVGFPNRFDSRFTDLHLSDPNSGITWKTPGFSILALSYQPNHIIAQFADRQTLAWPGDSVTVTSSDMLASVTFEPDTLLAVNETLLRTHDLKLAGAAGWHTEIGSFSFSTRQSREQDLAQDVVLDAKRISPTRAFKAFLDPGNTQPPMIETLTANLTLGFNAPWDRVAVERGAPEVTSIRVNSAAAHWGTLDVSARGRLKVAPGGQITGKLNLTIRNWRDVLAMLVTSRILTPGLASRLEAGLALLTSTSANPENLSAPLIFDKGQLSIAFLRIGRAPRFQR